MSKHSVVEAKNQLSALIDKALGGEHVVITRHGRPVVELRAVDAPPRRITEADIAWLDKHRGKRKAMKTDAAALVRQMRDEEWR